MQISDRSIKDAGEVDTLKTLLGITENTNLTHTKRHCSRCSASRFNFDFSILSKF